MKLLILANLTCIVCKERVIWEKHYIVKPTVKCTGLLNATIDQWELRICIISWQNTWMMFWWLAVRFSVLDYVMYSTKNRRRVERVIIFSVVIWGDSIKYMGWNLEQTITVWRTKESTLTLSLSLRISPFWRPAGTWGFLPPSSSGASPSHPWLWLDVEVIKLNLNNKIETRKKIVLQNQFSYWNCIGVSFTWLSFNSHSRAFLDRQTVK